MKNINAIIFDLGGVLFNIDYQKTIDEFKKLGISKTNYLYCKQYQSKLFDELETGLITSKHFLLELQKDCKQHSLINIKRAWNSMLLDLPRSRVKLLKKIKSKKSIFLLSNTNEIHISEIEKKIGTNNYTEFYNLFTKVYYSHKIKIRKPNKEAFMLILKENHLSAEEVLFIDDSIQHINAAKKTGINSVLLENNQDIINFFSDKAL